MNKIIKTIAILIGIVVLIIAGLLAYTFFLGAKTTKTITDFNEKTVKQIDTNAVMIKASDLTMEIESFFAQEGRFPTSWNELPAGTDYIDANTGKEFVFKLIDNGENVQVCAPEDKSYPTPICIPRN